MLFIIYVESNITSECKERNADELTFYGLDDITSNPFTSGFTGGGWKIDNTAHAEFSSASIRGTLSVYELLLQQLRATNGSVLITAVAKVESIELIDDYIHLKTHEVTTDNVEQNPMAVDDLI